LTGTLHYKALMKLKAFYRRVLDALLRQKMGEVVQDSFQTEKNLPAPNVSQGSDKEGQDVNLHGVLGGPFPRRAVVTGLVRLV
jgi:hypothetical protein